jgi:hypothetical protein
MSKSKLKNIPVSGVLKKGDRVKIYNQSLSGEDFFEGEATLMWKLYPEEYAEFWAVQFDSEEHGTPVYRWVRAENKIVVPKNLTVILKNSKENKTE